MACVHSCGDVFLDVQSIQKMQAILSRELRCVLNWYLPGQLPPKVQQGVHKHRVHLECPLCRKEVRLQAV
jgi:hypothetical protein